MGGDCTTEFEIGLPFLRFEQNFTGHFLCNIIQRSLHIYLENLFYV